MLRSSDRVDDWLAKISHQTVVTLSTPFHNWLGGRVRVFEYHRLLYCVASVSSAIVLIVSGSFETPI